MEQRNHRLHSRGYFAWTVSIMVLAAVLMPQAFFLKAATVTFSAKADIFAAGGANTAADGIAPDAISFTAGGGQIFSFPSVLGSVSFGGSLDGADGAPGITAGTTGSNFNPQGVLSGIVDDPGNVFLDRIRAIISERCCTVSRSGTFSV